MRKSVEFLMAIALMIAGTWFVVVAWWAVAVVAALWASVRPGDRGLALKAGVAGMSSWIAILLFASSVDSVGRVAEVAGTAMGVGPTALLVLMMAYPALLASSAAALVRALRNAIVAGRTRSGSRAAAYRPARPVGR